MKTRLPLAALALALFATASFAQSSMQAYGPFGDRGLSGASGYQEIRLSDTRWYVAYEGSRSMSPEWVDAAWAARSAQLCSAAGASHFIELRYPFEGVTRQPEALSAAPGPQWQMQPVKGPIYTPIFIPSASGGGMMRFDAPSKLAAIRCVADLAVLNEPARAVAAQAALQEARRLNVMNE